MNFRGHWVISYKKDDVLFFPNGENLFATGEDADGPFVEINGVRYVPCKGKKSKSPNAGASPHAAELAELHAIMASNCAEQEAEASDERAPEAPAADREVAARRRGPDLLGVAQPHVRRRRAGPGRRRRPHSSRLNMNRINCIFYGGIDPKADYVCVRAGKNESS